MTKHIIFQNNENCCFEDEGGNKTEECVYLGPKGYCDCDEIALEDQRLNLDKTLENKIVCIADLGFWNGRVPGYRIMGNNLNEILSNLEDINEIYLEGDDVFASCHHHDNVHHLRYREIKTHVGAHGLYSRVVDGRLTEEDVELYTRPLGHYIREIYGLKE